MWPSRAERSFAEPIWPRPPARVTAMASGAVAEPAICGMSVLEHLFERCVVVTGALMINGDVVHGKRAASLEGMVSMKW
jgi:hypothetical protein